VRFSVFEVDLATGELRKSGAKVRLQEQPFQILAMLLEQPGNVVTREEIQKRLWPADTFVDFDRGVNEAIRKLRDALNDSAGTPRFIETLPRRGYRFIAGVQRDHTPPVPPPAPRWLTRTLFALTQVMYLVFYLVALVKWERVDVLADTFLSASWANLLVKTVLVTASIGIVVRLYLLSSVVFDQRELGENFRHIFLAVLVLDQLWAGAPFLIMHKIGVGAAFAVMAALLYLPFSERTLISMAYPPPSATPVPNPQHGR
jgi:DNA-binding winged helix-turn-helix (wHTH) protein